MRKALSIVAAVAVLAAGSLALVGLSTPSAAVAQETEDIGSPEDANATIRAALQGLVDDATITSAQADAVASTLSEQFQDRRQERRQHHRQRHAVRGLLGEAASIIGLEPEEMAEAIQGGATVAEIAEDNGVDTQTVIDGLLAEVTERVDQALADEKIDEARAEELKANAEDHINELMNKVFARDAA